MSRANQQASMRINGLKSNGDSNGAPTSTHGGEYIKRARRRRLDLKTLHGTLRESARVYRELAEGRITMLEAETRSRVLRRHSEILTALEQRDQVAEIQRQLEALRSPNGLRTYALEAAGAEIDNALIREEAAA